MPVSDLRVLAYYGDCVYENWIRELAISRYETLDVIHAFTIKHVCTEFQSQLMQKLSPVIPEALQEIARRGRNIPVPQGRRANQQDYRAATAFEAVIGHVAIHDASKLADIKKWVLLQIND